MNLPDLVPKQDVRGGAGDVSVPPRNGRNGLHLRTPPLTNVLQMAQILVLVAFAISWWTKRESSSDVVNTAQNMSIEQHGKRLDDMSTDIKEITRQQAQNTDDLHQLMTKFRIMVELVDGTKQKPELHR